MSEQSQTIEPEVEKTSVPVTAKKVSGVVKTESQVMKIAKFVIGVALVSLLINMPAFWILKKNQISIAVVDVQSLLLEHEKKITQELYAKSASGNFDPQSGAITNLVEAQTKKFVERMEKEIVTINESCGCVILNKATLLTKDGKVTDYTQRVRDAIYK